MLSGKNLPTKKSHSQIRCGLDSWYGMTVELFRDMTRVYTNMTHMYTGMYVDV